MVFQNNAVTRKFFKKIIYYNISLAINNLLYLHTTFVYLNDSYFNFFVTFNSLLQLL